MDSISFFDTARPASVNIADASQNWHASLQRVLDANLFIFALRYKEGFSAVGIFSAAEIKSFAVLKELG